MNQQQLIKNKKNNQGQSAQDSTKLHQPLSAGQYPYLPARGIISNHGMLLLGDELIHAKLKISQQWDMYEKEADRVAEQVLLTPEQKEGVIKRMQMQNVNPIARVGSGSTFLINNALQSSGHPLDPSVREFMEPRFGKDFSHVRIHTDTEAAIAAETVNSKAFTVGSQIVFGQGYYSPGSSDCNKLLAHELAHVVQQENGLVSNQLQRDEISYRTIDWNDFLGIAPDDTTFDGATFSYIKMIALTSNDYIQKPKPVPKGDNANPTENIATAEIKDSWFYKIKAYMKQEKSWVKPEFKKNEQVNSDRSIKLLAHERGHFNISHQIAEKAKADLMLNYKTVEATACGEKTADEVLLEKLETIWDRQNKWYNLNNDIVQSDYDSVSLGTDHGRDPEKQAGWNNDIDAGLPAYNLDPLPTDQGTC